MSPNPLCSRVFPCGQRGNGSDLGVEFDLAEVELSLGDEVAGVGVLGQELDDDVEVARARGR